MFDRKLQVRMTPNGLDRGHKLCYIQDIKYCTQKNISHGFIVLHSEYMIHMISNNVAF